MDIQTFDEDAPDAHTHGSQEAQAPQAPAPREEARRPQGEEGDQGNEAQAGAEVGTYEGATPAPTAPKATSTPSRAAPRTPLQPLEPGNTLEPHDTDDREQPDLAQLALLHDGFVSAAHRHRARTAVPQPVRHGFQPSCARAAARRRVSGGVARRADDSGFCHGGPQGRADRRLVLRTDADARPEVRHQCSRYQEQGILRPGSRQLEPVAPDPLQPESARDHDRVLVEHPARRGQPRLRLGLPLRLRPDHPEERAGHLRGPAA